MVKTKTTCISKYNKNENGDPQQICLTGIEYQIRFIFMEITKDHVPIFVLLAYLVSKTARINKFHHISEFSTRVLARVQIRYKNTLDFSWISIIQNKENLKYLQEQLRLVRKYVQFQIKQVKKYNNIVLTQLPLQIP